MRLFGLIGKTPSTGIPSTWYRSTLKTVWNLWTQKQSSTKRTTTPTLPNIDALSTPSTCPTSLPSSTASIGSLNSPDTFPTRIYSTWPIRKNWDLSEFVTWPATLKGLLNVSLTTLSPKNPSSTTTLFKRPAHSIPHTNTENLST